MTYAIEIRGLDVGFGHGRGRREILRQVSIAVPVGATMGLVGESGSGKSTLARAIVGLVRPDAGQILIHDTSVTGASGPALTRQRRRVQMIPQDPYASLSPRRTVGQTLAEAIDPRRGTPDRHRAEIVELLAQVALDADVANRYPGAFSGGQRQRIAIARALAVKPEVIVADEVTSALDCSVQAEVLGVLSSLRAASSLSMLFISHDLGVVRHVSDEVAVLEGGVIVEVASKADLFAAPRHPYTKALLASVPDGGPLRPVPSAI